MQKTPKRSKRKTTDEFIAELRTRHGERYDYSRTIYMGCFEKITVICHIHGEFYPSASNHLKGTGCPVCQKDSTRLGYSGFVEKARGVHGDKFEYPEFIYQNNRMKVLIRCNSHGEFMMTPHDHLEGQGCPRCGIESHIAYTPEEFIEAARNIHGDRFDYRKTVYEHSQRKVTVTCPDHGDFLVNPLGHLAGYDCKKCRGAKRVTPSDKFFTKAREVHDGKYQYDERVYRNSRGKIRAECPKHGWFEQKASMHVLGTGCPGCGKEARLLDTATFISRAKEVQKRQYDYRETIYKGAHNRVTIICPRHGRFTQTACRHLFGQGCASCADDEHPGGYNPVLFNQYPELRGVPAKLYLIEFTLPDEKFLKVGITINDAQQRFRRYRKNMIVHKEIEMGLFKAYQLEQQLIQRHQGLAYTPRIKDFGGRTECFSLDRRPILLEEFAHL